MNTLLNACFSWFEAGIDLLFPPRCIVCGQPGEHWCKCCQSQVLKLYGPLCTRCGSPLRSRGPCMRCHSLGELKAVRSYAWYEGASVSPILALKYRPNQFIAHLLAQKMSQVVIKAGWHVDIVTAVPLGQARFKQRGYNQAGLLAAALASELSLDYAPQALVRRRDTASQVGLDRRGRMKNVQQAFRAFPKHVRGNIVLVVDDLLTSGATLSSCASTLMQAGAQAVYGVTAARARRTV